jgi:hypothetical protein
MAWYANACLREFTRAVHLLPLMAIERHIKWEIGLLVDARAKDEGVARYSSI